MRFFIAIGGLLVLVLSAVLVAPLFVNWTAFRADFEREASRILGQPVRVLGEAQARLLPFPSLTFTDVSVGPEGAEPVMTLERFRMDAELAPYLSGEIRIFQMSLDAPHLRIPLGAGEGLPAIPQGSGSTVILEDVEISNGRISLVNAETGRTREITAIDAQISAQTLSGPFSGSGTLTGEGEPMRFQLSSGRIEESGRWPMRLTLGSDRLALDASFDGETMLGDGEPDFTGRFALETRVPADGEEAELPPVRVASAIEITRREASLSDMRAEIGAPDDPYVLTGQGSFDIADLPHFDLALRGEQVDVDRLAGESTPEGVRPGFFERADAVRATLQAIPRIDIPGRIELTLPIVTAGDTTIRDVAFTGSPTGEGWTIRDLRAELPGQTRLEATGVLDIRERFAFTGDLLVAARQPGRFAEWVSGRAAPELAPLSRAGFSARVRLSPEMQSMEDLEVDVGGQQLLGSLSREGEPGARTIAADLAGEAADLDAFLAFARLFVAGGDAAEPVETLDLRFEAGPVAFDGLAAGHLGLDFSLSGGLLDLREMIATDLAGADLDARGTIADLGGRPAPDLAAEIAAEDPAGLARLVAERLPQLRLDALVDRAAAFGPLALSLSATTAQDDGAVALRADGTGGATAIDFDATLAEGVRALAEGGGYEVALSLASEEPASLLRQLGAQGLDLGLRSPLQASVRMAGGGSGPAEIDLEASAPGTSLAIDGTLHPSRDDPAADLAVRAASEDASLWLTAAGLSAGQGLDGLPLDLAGRLSFAEGGWALGDVTGTLAGTDIEASLTGSGGRPVTGRLSLGELSGPWLATLAYGVPPDLPTGDGLWPEEPFAAPLVPFAGFAVDLEAGRFDLGGGQALANLSARLEGERTRLRLVDLNGSLGEGQIRGEAEMSNAGGFGSLRLDLELVDAVLPVEATAIGGALSGRLTVEGSGRTFAEIAASLTGEGQATLRNGTLRGFEHQPFAGLLQAADRDGFAVTSQSVSSLVDERSGLTARYELGEVSAPLRVAVGVAQIGPLSVTGEEETLTLAGSLDARTADLSAEATLLFQPDPFDRIENATPSIAYRLDEADASFVLSGVEPLTSFLSLRAYAREQERLEALREELRETVRLRREARFYNAREAERVRAEAERQAALEAERLARVAEEEARRREEAERAAVREAERAARAAEQAAREAAAAAAQAAEAAPTIEPPPPFQFELPLPPQPGFQGLPGVEPFPLPSLGGG